jgi:hypothetical protein
MAWDEDTPNPGSDEAIEQGCTCAVLDNAHGRAFPSGSDGPCFWVSDNCPLHGAVSV